MTSWLSCTYVMFSCVFVNFPYGVLGQVWYLPSSLISMQLHLWPEDDVEIEFDRRRFNNFL